MGPGREDIKEAGFYPKGTETLSQNLGKRAGMAMVLREIRLNPDIVQPKRR